MSSGVASTWPWPIAVEPTARSSPISAAAGSVERSAPASAGSWLKPNALGGRHEPLGAELGAHRREDGVAGVREDVAQRAAARLAVGVLELARPRARPPSRRGSRCDGLRDAGLERAGERDDLEHRARRLGRGVGDPGEREHLAVARAHDRDAAEAAGERLDGRALDVGVDRGAHVAALAAARPTAITRSPARSSPPGRAGELGVELALEAGQPDRRVRRDAAALRSSAARSGGAGPTRPAISAASAPSSDSRASPSASGVPSRAWIVARGGIRVVRESCSPRRRPG